MGLKSDLKKLEKLSRQDLISEIKSSPSFIQTQKLLPNLKEDELVIVSSIFSSFLKVGWLDKELKNIEVKYILRETGDITSIGEESRSQLIDLHSTLIHRNIKFQKYLPYHFAILAHCLSEDIKKILFEAFVVITRGDLEMHETEESFLKSIGLCFKLSDREVTESLLGAKVLIEQRLNKIRINSEEEENIYQPSQEIHFDW